MPEQSPEFFDPDLTQRLLRVHSCVQAMLDRVGATDPAILFHCQMRAAGMICGAIAYNDENGITIFPQEESESDTTEYEENACLIPGEFTLNHSDTP